VAVAVVVVVAVEVTSMGPTAAVAFAEADVVGGLTVMVAMMAVELTVTTVDIYMSRLLLFEFGRCRYL